MKWIALRPNAYILEVDAQDREEALSKACQVPLGEWDFVYGEVKCVPKKDDSSVLPLATPESSVKRVGGTQCRSFWPPYEIRCEVCGDWCRESYAFAFANHLVCSDCYWHYFLFEVADWLRENNLARAVEVVQRSEKKHEQARAAIELMRQAIAQKAKELNACVGGQED